MRQDTITTIVMLVLLLAIILLIVIKLSQEMNNKESPIEWWQLVATQGADGKNHASATKLWLNIGAVIVSWVLVYMVLQVDWEDRGVEVIGVVGLYLLFISGVESYARHLQSKRGDVNGISKRTTDTA